MANGLRKWVAEKWVDIGARKKEAKGGLIKGFPKVAKRGY